MVYPLNPALMELLILTMINREDSYGYQIGQQMRQVSSMKDSTLYPVLRRLADSHYVEIYDQQYQGRNRKYYKITEAGKRQRDQMEQAWKEHIDAINKILESSQPAAEGEKV